MSLANFRTACESLKDYFGVVGIFGGNPALHPDFDAICEILRETIPFARRGIWCNNPIWPERAREMARTFNPRYSNLNVHLDAKAYALFKEHWPESQPFGLHQDSRHSPVFVAMKDVIEDEGQRWELISNCDINKHWSAMMGQFRGELRAWFCEIAGAQAMLHQHEPRYPDTGVEVTHEGRVKLFTGGTEGAEKQWWELSMRSFDQQVHKHCHECGVPLRGYGSLAQSEYGVEQTSAAHQSVYETKRRLPLQVVTNVEQLKSKGLKFTDYMGGARA
jgi:hypothetical protein